MSRSILAIVCMTGACAGTFGVSDDRSWTEQMTAAERHEQLANVHAYNPTESRVGAGFECGDQVLEDQSTTGGQPITYFQPCCRTFQEEMRASQAARVDRERALARHDRHTAALLARSEADACRAVPPAERTHSPFAHTKEIAAVTPVRENGTLDGVRIAFRPVPGLRAEWIKNAITCRQAQWVVFGRDPKLDPNDPTLLETADVSVTDVDGHVEVLITTHNPADAEVALMRANQQAALAVR